MPNAVLENIFPNAAQMDAQNAILNRIADKLGAYETPLTWAALQAQIRTGNVGLVLNPGDQLSVDTAETLTVSVSGEGVTAASVTSKDAFLAAAGTERHDYEFTFTNGGWHYDGAPVTLSDYGLSVTGTPDEGDAIHIHRTATAYDFDVQGIDEDEPVNPALKHVLSIQCHKIFSYGTIPFDPQQFLYAVQASEWPDGLPAGKYKVTLDHGTYSGGTEQDGTYVFTTTQVVPVGGGIRHSTMGAYQSGGYNKAQITGGGFLTYGADTLTTIETGLATAEYNAATDADAVSLGTTTGSNPTYKVGDSINFAPRNSSGGNRWSTSWLRQYLNSDEAEFTWTPKTIWSRNVSGVREGFLHAIDPELRAVLCKVRTRYALSLSDGSGYEDVEDYVKLDTMLDVFGQQINSVSEGPVNGEGTVTRTDKYSLWKMLSIDGDRIKYDGTTARAWWMGSTSSGSSCLQCRVTSSGSNNYVSAAAATTGIVPSLFIG